MYWTFRLFFTIQDKLIIMLVFPRLNRKAKYDLECDLKDKASAIKIDNHNAELRNNSSDITFKTDAVKIQAE